MDSQRFLEIKHLLDNLDLKDRVLKKKLDRMYDVGDDGKLPPSLTRPDEEQEEVNAFIAVSGLSAQELREYALELNRVLEAEFEED